MTDRPTPGVQQRTSDVQALPPLPWGRQDIERLLPHREPFLFVDRVEQFDFDAGIVGERVWSDAEARITAPDGSRAVPAAYLTECMAQVGALLVLAKSENRGKLIYFLRVDRVRFRAPVRPGQRVRVEARPVSLRGRIGTLDGTASVDGRVVGSGRMTFALADRDEART